MKRLLTLLPMLALVVAAAASAAKLEGVTLPDTATVGGKTLVLNGMGLREFLWVDVYVGGLYLETKATTPDAVMAQKGPYRITMNLLHDVSRKQFADNWEDDLKNNNPGILQRYPDQVKQFIALFDSAKDGDTVVMDFVPGTGVSVTHNGKLMGTVAGDGFAHDVLHCYVGPNPPTSKLKRGMLGGND